MYVDWAPAVGFINQQYSVFSSSAGWEDMKFKDHYALMFGIHIDFKPVALSDKFRIQLAINTFKQQVEGSLKVNDAGVFISDIDCKAQYLNFKLGVRYVYPKFMVRPYLGIFGETYTMLSYSGSYVVSKLDENDISEVIYEGNPEMLRGYMGYGLNFGFEIMTGEKSKIALNGTYSYGTYDKPFDSGSNAYINEFTIKTLSTQLAFYFRL